MRTLPGALAIILTCPLYLFSQQDSTNVNQLAELSLEQLMNIKVETASGFLQPTAEAPSTITVITAKQIAERGYEQLEDALRDVPGIDLIHINGYAPTLIYFRGMYGAENLRALLLIDGITENNILGSNDMAGPAYSLHNIERIEIIWGPVSALYGAHAFGGVINLITKKGTDMEGLHYEQGFGSFNTSFQKLYMGLRKSRFEFSIAGTIFNSDGPRFTNRDPNYTGSYVDNAYSLNTTLTYHGNKSQTTLGFRVYQTPMGWGTYSNSPTKWLHLPPQGYKNIGTIGILQRDIRGENSGLDNPFLKTWFAEHAMQVNEKLKLTGRIIYRETGIDENSYVYVTADGNRMIRAPIASYSNRIRGDIGATYSLSEKHRFNGGIQLSQDNVETGSRGITFDFNTVYLLDGRDTLVNLASTFLPRQFDIRNNFGSYLQYRLQLNWIGKTYLTAGFRYDRNSYFGDAYSPRLSIVNKPNEQWSFKLHAGEAFRAPTNLEIYQTPPTGNFKLDQEKIRTYEVNVIYTPSKKARLQLNGFRNKLTDVIILGNLSGLSPDKNPGEFKINGAEAMADLSFGRNVTAFANVTFQDAKGRNIVTGQSGRLPGVAKWKGNLGVNVEVEELFSLNLTGNWVGERPVQRTNPHGPVKGYFLTHLAIRTKPLFKDRVTASLTVHNITDVKWLDPGFRTADGLLYSTVLEQPGINGIFKIGIDL